MRQDGTLLGGSKTKPVGAQLAADDIQLGLELRIAEVFSNDMSPVLSVAPCVPCGLVRKKGSAEFPSGR